MDLYLGKLFRELQDYLAKTAKLSRSHIAVMQQWSPNHDE
jgi:hypothetical protein